MKNLQGWHRTLQMWALVRLSLLSLSSAAVNRTIDDQYGDEITGLLPKYSPSYGWAQGIGCPASACALQFDPSQCHQGTWHDTTWGAHDKLPRTLTVHFNGTAVYVFCIIVNSGFTGPGISALTNLTFSIDGLPAGQFLHDPTDDAQQFYQVPVYSHTNLPDQLHTFEVHVVPGPDMSNSLMLFDYIMYTTTANDTQIAPPTSPSPPISPIPIPLPPASIPSSSSTPLTNSSPTPGTTPQARSSVPAAVGGAVGGTALLVLAALLFYRTRTRRRPAHHVPSLTPLSVKHDQSPLASPSSPSNPYSDAPPYAHSSAVEGDDGALPRDYPSQLSTRMLAPQQTGVTAPAPPLNQPTAQPGTTLEGGFISLSSTVEAAVGRIRELEQQMRQMESLPPYEQEQLDPTGRT